MKKVLHFIVVMFLFSLFFASIRVNASLDDGLFLHYTFDDIDGTTVKDSSGNGNDGTMYGDMICDASMIGKACTFDGVNDYIKVPHSADFDVTELTLSTWVQTPDSMDQIFRAIFAKCVGNCYHTVRDYNLYLYSPDTSSISQVQGFHFSSAVPWGGTVFSMSNFYEPSSWHHVVLTVDTNGTKRHYSDGILIHQEVGLPGVANNNYPLFIGKADNILKGELDDVRIYNRALSESEVKNLYNIGHAIANTDIELSADQTENLHPKKSNSPGMTTLQIVAKIFSSTKDTVVEIEVPKGMSVKEYKIVPLSDGSSPVSNVEIFDKDGSKFFKFSLKDGISGRISFPFIVYFPAGITYDKQEVTISAKIFSGKSLLLEKGKKFTARNPTRVFMYYSHVSPSSHANGYNISYKIWIQTQCNKNGWRWCDPEGARHYNSIIKIPLPKKAIWVSGGNYDKKTHTISFSLGNFFARYGYAGFVLKYKDLAPGETIQFPDMSFSGKMANFIDRTYTYPGLKKIAENPTTKLSSYSVPTQGGGVVADDTNNVFITFDLRNNGSASASNIEASLIFPSELHVHSIHIPRYANQYGLKNFNWEKVKISYLTNKRSQRSVAKTFGPGSRWLTRSDLGLANDEWISTLYLQFPKFIPGAFIQREGHWDQEFTIRGDVAGGKPDTYTTVKQHIVADGGIVLDKNIRVYISPRSYMPMVGWYSLGGSKISFLQGENLPFSLAFHPHGSYHYHNGIHLFDPSIFLQIPNGFTLDTDSINVNGTSKYDSIKQIKPVQDIGDYKVYEIILKAQQSWWSYTTLGISGKLSVDTNAIPGKYDFSKFFQIGSRNYKYQVAGAWGFTSYKDNFGLLGTPNTYFLGRPTHTSWVKRDVYVRASDFGINDKIVGGDSNPIGTYNPNDITTWTKFDSGKKGTVKTVFYNSSTSPIKNFVYTSVLPNLNDGHNPVGGSSQWKAILSAPIDVSNIPGAIVEYSINGTSFSTTVPSNLSTIKSYRIKIASVPTQTNYSFSTQIQAPVFSSNDNYYKKAFLKNEYSVSIGGKVETYPAGIKGLYLVPQGYDVENDSYAWCHQHHDRNPNISMNECIELVKIYRNNNGKNWKNKNGWKQASDNVNYIPICNWYGLACEGGKLVKIDLSNNTFKNHLSKDFSKVFVNLEELNLKGNSLPSFDWSKLKALPKLKILDLSENAITTPLSDFTQLPRSLEKLRVFDNKISSISIDWNQLPRNLKIFNVAKNSINIAIVSWNGLPNTLVSLGLNYNNIPSIPNTWNGIRGQYLGLDYNDISILPSTWSGLPNNLRGLYLSHNQISILPNSWSGFPSNMSEIALFSNLIQKIPDVWTGLPSLDKLSLDNNYILKFPTNKPSAKVIRSDTNCAYRASTRPAYISDKQRDFATCDKNELLVNLDDAQGSVVFKDISGKKRNGKCSGSTCPTATFGVLKGAQKFDGMNDAINFGKTLFSDVNTAPGLTVCHWFRSDRLNGENILYNKEYLFEAGIRDGYYSFAWGKRNNGNLNWSWSTNKDFQVETGKWTHACLTYDQNKQILYKDGIKKYEKKETGPILSSYNQGYQYPFCIGARSYKNSSNRMTNCEGSLFSGSIDKLGVWYRALQPEDVSELYHEWICAKVEKFYADKGVANAGKDQKNDCEKLQNLYQTLGGDGWKNKTNWLTNPDLSTWHGITLKNNRVDKVVLQSNNMQGEIKDWESVLPAKISHGIWFNGNKSITAIPTTWEGLPKMKHVGLYTMGYSELPSTWEGIPNTVIGLSLARNNITVIPDDWSKLPSKILKIWLNDNKITKIPATWSGISDTLQELRLNNNKITGLPLSWEGLKGTKLQKLYLNNNAITKLPSTWDGLPSGLKRLYLSENQIGKDSIPIKSKSCSFDGVDDYIDANFPTISGRSNETLSYWFKGGSQPASKNIVHLSAKSSSNSSSNSARFRRFYNNYLVFHPNGGGTDYVYMRYNNLDDMKGRHLMTFTKSGRLLKLYLDGKQINATTLSHDLLDISGLWLGRVCGGNYCNHYDGGQISDTRVYNRALSSDEVEKLYINPNVVSKNGLVLHYDFKDIEGNTVMDKSGNGNNGIMHGGMSCDETNTAGGGLPNTWEGLPSSLVALWLNNNRINTVPSTWDGMRVLTKFNSLRLHDNLISAIPSEPSAWTKLPTSLFELNLSNNKISKLPTTWNGLAGMTHLYLYNNSIITLPETWNGLSSQLKHFSLHNNNIQLLPYSWGISFPALQSGFTLNNNYIPRLGNDATPKPTKGQITSSQNCIDITNKPNWVEGNQRNLHSVECQQSINYQICYQQSSQGLFDDCVKLVTLYNTLGGKNWKVEKKRNWLTNADINTWGGITVNNGRVERLELDGFGNIGAISGSWGDIIPEKVKELFLRENKIIKIPVTWEGLPDGLLTLSLYRNELTAVPSWDSLPKSLLHLALSGNPGLFKGKNITWDKLPPKLQTLYLAQVSLSEIPDWSTLPSTVTLLHLAYNKLTRLPSFSSLPSRIEDLTFEYNKITTLGANGWKGLANKNNLEKFTIQNNQITTPVDAWSDFGGANLKVLNLGDNNVTSIPDSRNGLSTKLEVLGLNITKLGGSLVDGKYAIKNLKTPKLRELYLRNNKITNIPDTWTDWKNQFPELEVLDLGKNMLTQIPEENWNGMPSKMIKLYLDNNDDIIDIPKSWKGLPKLKVFALSGNFIRFFPTDQPDGYDKNTFTFDHNCAINNRPNLYVQNPQKTVAQCQGITNRFVCNGGLDVNINECKWLLDLFNDFNGRRWYKTDGWLTGNSVNNWTGVTVENISGVNHITKLKLFDNNIKGNVSATTWKLPKGMQIKELLLGGNEISVSDWKQIPGTLTKLDLSDNNITSLSTSDLPKGLTKLNLSGNTIRTLTWKLLPKTLEQLNLSNNNITSVDTWDFADNLRQLYLNNNILSSIPSSWNNLGKLEILHLHYNRIPSIPKGWKALKKIQKILLNNNLITSTITTWDFPTTLATLHLDENLLTNIPTTSDGLVDDTHLSRNCLDKEVTYKELLTKYNSLIQKSFAECNGDQLISGEVITIPSLEIDVGDAILNKGSFKMIKNNVKELNNTEKYFTILWVVFSNTLDSDSLLDNISISKSLPSSNSFQQLNKQLIVSQVGIGGEMLQLRLPYAREPGKYRIIFGKNIKNSNGKKLGSDETLEFIIKGESPQQCSPWKDNGKYYSTMKTCEEEMTEARGASELGKGDKKYKNAELNTGVPDWKFYQLYDQTSGSPQFEEINPWSPNLTLGYDEKDTTNDLKKYVCPYHCWAGAKDGGRTVGSTYADEYCGTNCWVASHNSILLHNKSKTWKDSITNGKANFEYSCDDGGVSVKCADNTKCNPGYVRTSACKCEPKYHKYTCSPNKNPKWQVEEYSSISDTSQHTLSWYGTGKIIYKLWNLSAPSSSSCLSSKNIVCNNRIPENSHYTTTNGNVYRHPTDNNYEQNGYLDQYTSCGWECDDGSNKIDGNCIFEQPKCNNGGSLMYAKQPAFDDKSGCRVGKYKDSDDNTDPAHRYWECISGLESITCSAKKIASATCRNYPGTYVNQPGTSMFGCDIGNFEDMNDTATHWKWKCIYGLYGHSSVECSAGKDPSIVSTCSDGKQNGDETGVDCGGSCKACPTCNDGIQNGNETGVDCGGSCKACPTCSDGKQNGDETGVDCGGNCSACNTGGGETAQCTGTDPSHATMCNGDNQGLTQNLSKTVVSACTSTTKCEWICAAGYHKDGNSCVATSTGAKQYQCTPSGSWKKL